jgi:hypothetical protein
MTTGLASSISGKRPLNHPAFTQPSQVGPQNRPAEQIYDHILHRIVEPLIGNTTTFGSDLDKMAKHFFGVKWLGVFSVDRVPKNIPKGNYAVINLDESDLPGSHWVGVVGDSIVKGGKNDVLVYDSYGRDPKKIMPKLAKKFNFKSTDLPSDGASDIDAEQGILETNCGARTLAALILHNQFGKAAFMNL